MNIFKSCNYKTSWGIAYTAVILAAPAQDKPAINLDPEALFQTQGPLGAGALGWSFTVTAPVNVTAFGYYDAGRDGLLQSHQVGIWKAAKPQNPPLENFQDAILLGVTTIPSEQTAALDGPWRKVFLDVSLTLQPGLYAVAASTAGGSPEDVVKIGFRSEFFGTMDPRIEVGAPGSREGDFSPPDQWVWLADTAASFGPMFFIQPIPEPSALGLLWAACVTHFALGRRRRRNPVN